MASWIGSIAFEHPILGIITPLSGHFLEPRRRDLDQLAAVYLPAERPRQGRNDPVWHI
jgi:hypothetical protein